MKEENKVKELKYTLTEYLAISEALAHAINAATKKEYKQVTKFVDVVTSLDVPAPTKKQIESGAVMEVVDISKTFKESNTITTYNAEVIIPLVAAQEVQASIRLRNEELFKELK